MKPEDLSRIVVPSDPRLHNGRLAYVRTKLDVEGDRYNSEVWLHVGGDDRRLTAGPGDSAPRWSPDGSRLAFLRRDDDGVSQVAIIRPDGGEARVVTSFARGVEELEWSPDGAVLAVVAVTWTDEWDDLDEEERQRRPKRITTIPYRFDNRGALHDRRRHLWLVDPDGGSEDRCLTPGEFDVEAPAWSPDGTTIAIVSDRDPNGGLVMGTDVWEVDAATGEITRAVAWRGMWSLATYRPDGVLHVVGHPEARWPVTQRLFRREPDGSLSDLTGRVDRSVLSISGGPARVVWRDDVAYSGLENAGRVEVVATHPDGRVDHVVQGDRMVMAIDVEADRLVFTASSPTSTGDVFEQVGEADEQVLVPLSTDLELVDADHFRAPSGGHEIDVWVYAPEGDGPVPVLLNIHGGPAGQYSFGFSDEFQVYAGAGYAVVACNPRGSSGRGQAWLDDVVGEGWGVVDVADVAAALEAALARHPRLDPQRIGIMGGSYGGFLTAWMIAHDDRFLSAVVERALLSFPSFAGTSDIAVDFPRAYLQADYPDAWPTWWERSPLSVADRIGTPTLILHSETDFRCPIEQAEQLFTALLRNGTPVEFLRFPGEGHELSRSGKPRHRVERFEAILEWHDRWLRPVDREL